MLRLTLKETDYIMIGDNIKIMLERTQRGAMAIAIDAPKSVPILRGEVYERSVAQQAATGGMEMEILRDNLFEEKQKRYAGLQVRKQERSIKEAERKKRSAKRKEEAENMASVT
jgi:carbon storage regulator